MSGDAPFIHDAGEVILSDASNYFHGSDKAAALSSYTVVRKLGAGYFKGVYEVQDGEGNVFALAHLDLHRMCNESFLKRKNSTPCSQFMTKVFREIDNHIKLCSADGRIFERLSTGQKLPGSTQSGIPVLDDYWFTIPKAHLMALAGSQVPALDVKRQGGFGEEQVRGGPVGVSLYILMEMLPCIDKMNPEEPLVYGNELYNLAANCQLVQFPQDATEEAKEEMRQRDTDDLMEGLYQLCEIVANVHDKSIISRDLRYSNVSLARDKFGNVTAYAFDFGLSQDTDHSDAKTGAIGAPYCQAPEIKTPPTVVWKIRIPFYVTENDCEWTSSIQGRAALFAVGVRVIDATQRALLINGEKWVYTFSDAFLDIEVYVTPRGFEVTIPDASLHLIDHTAPWSTFVCVRQTLPFAFTITEGSRYTNKVDSWAFGTILEWLFFEDVRVHLSKSGLELVEPQHMKEFIDALKSREGLVTDPYPNAPLQAPHPKKIIFADPPERLSMREALDHRVWEGVKMRRKAKVAAAAGGGGGGSCGGGSKMMEEG